jgi:hypothetical protein
MIDETTRRAEALVRSFRGHRCHCAAEAQQPCENCQRKIQAIAAFGREERAAALTHQYDSEGIQARSELNRLVDVVRCTPGQPSGFLHSAYDAAELLWKWALKFQPLPAPPAASTPEQSHAELLNKAIALDDAAGD